MATVKTDERYFNFPIQLLKDFMINPRAILNDICHYAVYENSLKLCLGSEIENMRDSASFYNMSFDNISQPIKNGKKLYESIPQNSPKTGLNISIFWDFYKNDKSEFDKICLLAFLGIKSILGSKPYCKATNLYLWSRMDGKANSIVDVSQLSNEIRKYANRYQIEKIKTELILNWNLIHYSRITRGFYVSFKMNLEDLIFEAEKKRESRIKKELKQTQKVALNKALERLNARAP